MPNKTIDIALMRNMAVALSDALDVLEQSGNARKDLQALKTEVQRIEADREKMIAGIRNQAEVEAKATAEKIVSEARAVAKGAIEQAHAAADAHYSSVKETAKRAFEQAAAAIKEKHVELETLNEKCADLQAELDDLHRERDEAIASVRDLADKFKEVA